MVDCKVIAKKIVAYIIYYLALIFYFFLYIINIDIKLFSLF